MDDTEERERRALAKQAGHIAAEKAVQVASTTALGPFGGAAISALWKLGEHGLGALVREQAEMRAEQFECEVERALFEGGIDPADLMKAGPEYQEVIFESFRRSMEAIDPAAIPALARMAAATLREGGKLTPFLRRTGRMLQDLGGDELSLLVRTLTPIRLASPEAQEIYFLLPREQRSGPTPLHVSWSTRHIDEDGKVNVETSTHPVASELRRARLLLDLLRNHRFSYLWTGFGSVNLPGVHSTGDQAELLCLLELLDPRSQ